MKGFLMPKKLERCGYKRQAFLCGRGAVIGLSEEMVTAYLPEWE
jgi:hypothetical protein